MAYVLDMQAEFKCANVIVSRWNCWCPGMIKPSIWPSIKSPINVDQENIL